MKVADHVWYVTGGASGLGEATVRKLHELGGYVSIWDISFEQAEALANDLNSKSESGNKRALAAQVDVVSEEEVIEAIKKTDEAWSKVIVGGCVNCGGVGMAGKIINSDGEPFDLDTFRTVVEINVSFHSRPFAILAAIPYLIVKVHLQLIGTFNVSRLTASRLVRDAPKPIPKPDESTLDRGVIINTAR